MSSLILFQKTERKASSKIIYVIYFVYEGLESFLSMSPSQYLRGEKEYGSSPTDLTSKVRVSVLHLTCCICLPSMLFSEVLVMELTAQNGAVMCPLLFIQVWQELRYRLQRNDALTLSLYVF